MSSLSHQLEQLNKQKQDLEKRIEEERLRTEKLNNNASVERLEALVQPLTDRLEHRDIIGHAGPNTTIVKYRDKTIRQQHQEEHDKQTDSYNVDKSTEPFKYINKLPPQKNKELLEEEIFTTIISILKQQQQEIQSLKKRLS